MAPTYKSEGPCDVVVIGAGPGGLIAAHAITVAAPDLKVVIFERNPVLQRRGAGLGLDVNGQKALKAINEDVFTAVMACGVTTHTFNNLRPDGRVLNTMDGRSNGARNYMPDESFRVPCLMGWYELQQALMEQLPPTVGLCLGAEFERYVEDAESGTITVHFTPRSNTPPVTASLLVASDGYFSRVRQQVAADGPPEYQNTIVWRARLPATPDMLSIGMKETGDAVTMVFDTGRIWLSYPIGGGGQEVVWTASASDEKLKDVGVEPTVVVPRLWKQAPPSSTTTDSSAAADTPASSTDATGDGAAGSGAAAGGNEDQEVDTQGFAAQTLARGEAAKARLLKALQGWSQPFLDIVAGTPAQQVVEHGLFIRPADKMSAEAYGKGRVVVLGDAAHPVRPTGQGLNLAVEDCHQLGEALAGVAAAADINLDALDAFRAKRAERVGPVMAHTSGQGAAAYKKKTDAERAQGMNTMKGESNVMSSEEWMEYIYKPDWAPLGHKVAVPA